ncbi:MAG: TorF family putative porin [Methylomicrobium sp.]
MTSISINFLLTASLFASMLGPSSAQADWHGDLKFLSDYIYRGYSKSRGNPVVQAHVDYQNDTGWFAGLGLSQVRFDDQLNTARAEIEIKPYLGWSLPLSADWRAELSASGYLYDNKLFGHDANYVEIYGSLHYQDWLSARASVAPDAYQRQATVLNYELNYRRDLLDDVQFSAGLGYYQAGALLGQDYFYWNAGISWFVTSYLAIDMRYVDVALSHGPEPGHHADQFYPRQQDNNYQFSITLGF